MDRYGLQAACKTIKGKYVLGTTKTHIIVNIWNC